MKFISAAYMSVLVLSLSLNAVLLLSGSARADKASAFGTVNVHEISIRVKQSPLWQALSAKVAESRNDFRADMSRLDQDALPDAGRTNRVGGTQGGGNTNPG